MTWAAAWYTARWSWRPTKPPAPPRTASDPVRGELPAAGPYRTSAAALVPRPAAAPPRRSPQLRVGPQAGTRYPSDLHRLHKQLMGDFVAGRCTRAEALVRWEDAVGAWMHGK